MNTPEESRAAVGEADDAAHGTEADSDTTSTLTLEQQLEIAITVSRLPSQDANADDATG